MTNPLKSGIKFLLHKMGWDIVRYLDDWAEGADARPDFSDLTHKICETVRPYTMTTPERINAIVDATTHIAHNSIQGSFVECGVWKGGSVIAMIKALQHHGIENRDIFLYDTFAGMNAPTDDDISWFGSAANIRFESTKTSENSSNWCMAPLEEVRNNVLATGYPASRIHFVKGKVEDTMPEILPQNIALLRLDTDWYESTKHEMQHLYPLLSTHGILLIDDYGYWRGQKKAIDEYIAKNNLKIFLARVDSNSRIAIKPAT